MFNLGNNRSSLMFGVIIDIGSASVGVGILKSDQNEKLPEIIFSHRVLMRAAGEEMNLKERMRRMREALFSACLVLSKDGLQKLGEYDSRAKIQRLLVTCSSPWSHTITRAITYEREEEFKITEALIRELVLSAEKEIKHELDEMSIAHSFGYEIVERATVNIKVNGYTIHEPIGLKGLTLSLSHITGLIPSEILESIHEVQTKILTGTHITSHTFMLVAYCVLRDLFPKTDSLCIVDVTGESTEIGIVEDGVLQETVHAPYGSNTLVREISSRGNGSIEDIYTSLRALGEQTSHDSVQQVTAGYLEAYKKVLGDTFLKLHKERSIPRTMVITASPELEKLFRICIPEIAFESAQVTCTILELQKGILEEIAKNHNSDVFIAIGSRFFHKLHGCGEIAAE